MKIVFFFYIYTMSRCTGIAANGKRCRKLVKNCKQHNQPLNSAQLNFQNGDGILKDTYEFIKRRIDAVREGPSGEPTSRLKKFMDENNDRKITSVQLGRKPIISPVRKALDALSFGGFSRKAKEMNYDDVYHNYLIVTLDDGRKIKLEKNHVVEYKNAKDSDFKSQIFDIPLNGKDLTLTEMIANASADKGSEFWKYRGGSNNCQEFTRDMIVKNGLLPENPTSIDLQDSKSLLNTLPGGQLIPNMVTDTAAVGDRLLHGDGLISRGVFPNGIIPTF